MANASFSKSAFRNPQSAFRIHHSSFRIFEVVFPQIDVQTVMRWRCGSPEFTGAKPHTIDRVWLLAATVGIGVWIHERAVHTVDDAVLASDIAREASMP